MERFIYSVTVITDSSQEKTSVCCQQGSRNSGKSFQGSMEKVLRCKRHWEPCRYLHKMNIHRTPQGVREVNWVGMAPDWCREVAKAVLPSKQSRSWQATSTVTTEIKLDQLFDWRRYSHLTWISNSIDYCMRFETKEKGPLKADQIHQAEQNLFWFVQNESFPNVLKSTTNIDNKSIAK